MNIIIFDIIKLFLSFISQQHNQLSNFDVICYNKLKCKSQILIEFEPDIDIKLPEGNIEIDLTFFLLISTSS